LGEPDSQREDGVDVEVFVRCFVEENIEVRFETFFRRPRNTAAYAWRIFCLSPACLPAVPCCFFKPPIPRRIVVFWKLCINIIAGKTFEKHSFPADVRVRIIPFKRDAEHSLFAVHPATCRDRSSLNYNKIKQFSKVPIDLS